jgi:hypothetical protein
MPPKKEPSPSDVCNNPDAHDCAHEASRALESLGYKITGCVGCDTCKRPIRALEVKTWAEKRYPIVKALDPEGTYLIYQ